MPIASQPAWLARTRATVSATARGELIGIDAIRSPVAGLWTSSFSAAGASAPFAPAVSVLVPAVPLSTGAPFLDLGWSANFTPPARQVYAYRPIGLISLT